MKISNNRQKKTPYLDAVKKYISDGIACFDVPGHHEGNVNNKLLEYAGKRLFEMDVNAPIGLGTLSHPTGPLQEAQNLLAEACGVDHAFFLINGTSSGIIAMILASVKANEKIILPRNVHKSVMSALVLSGAVPVYVMPYIDNNLEIASQPSVDDYKKAIHSNPSAKAVFIINPTYFGSIMNLREITEYAHEKGMLVLVDEAHGAHFYFSSEGPITAMDANADIASVSMHKCGGSLTQSSFLVMKGDRVNVDEMQKTLNIINTTSPNTILMASLDAARQYMVTKGAEAIAKTVDLAKYAYRVINKIPGFRVRGKDYFVRRGSFNYDKTKLVIELDRLDIDGFKVYRLLKEKYHVQIELAETYVLLALITIGADKKSIDRLVLALKDISKEHFNKKLTYIGRTYESGFPFMMTRPRTAFHAPKKKVKIEDALYEISKESIMIYPPGIPLIVPGEVFTKDVIQTLKKYRKSKATILSTYSDGYVEVVDLEAWKRYSFFKKKIIDYVEKRITVPRIDGYKMPFEGEKHQATFILLPYRKDVWRDKALPAQKAYKEVILAIAKYEKVIVGISPKIDDSIFNEYVGLKNVEPIRIEYNDAWARDTAPLGVVNDNKLRFVDFRFNAWGGAYDGLYSNYQDDDLLSRRFADYMKLESYSVSNFILEGGSIHVDGQGTCIVTEACLLSPGRNPSCDKKDIEEELQVYLNVNKIIWIPHGIYLDETNEHVDNMIAYAKPGEVLLAWSKDKNSVQYKYSQKAYQILKNETDAKGRHFVIHKINLPSPQYMSKEEASGISRSKANAKSREANNLLSASYINFYQGKKFVIMPAFGDKEDAKAYAQMKEIFKDKDIIQINTREILLGGGNIHCITMQIPSVKGKNHES